MDELVLASDRTTLALRPEFGGAITRYCTATEARLFEWLRPLAKGSNGSVLATSCFPLVPFSGRIRAGRFGFAGRQVQLPLNFAPDKHAIHGHGWLRPWQVSEQSPQRAVLEYRHAADAWPWDYVASQAFELESEALTLTIAVHNRADSPMPAGIGIHPYFLRTPSARVTAAVTHVWETDDEVMPVRLAPIGSTFDLSRGVEVNRGFIDNAFTGWNGKALIEWPEWAVSLQLETAFPLTNLVVYTPLRQDFFCVEPVSHVTDAFNMMDRGENGHGATVLQPGESLSGRVSFRPLW